MTSLSCDVVPPGVREIWRELPLGVEEPGASISMGVEAIIAVGSSSDCTRLPPGLRARQDVVVGEAEDQSVWVAFIGR